MSRRFIKTDLELMLGALRAEAALVLGFGKAEVGRRKSAAVKAYAEKATIRAMREDPEGALRSIARVMREREADHGA